MARLGLDLIFFLNKKKPASLSLSIRKFKGFLIWGTNPDYYFIIT